MKNNENDHLRKFGNIIREHRKALGISQEELGFLSGLDRSYIGGIERGERNLTLLKIIKISNALKQPLHELFSKFEDIA